jgi:SAM-dependent methyltransferase
VRASHLQHLRCPGCQNSLELAETVERDGRIESGQLRCVSCQITYPIVRFVPRFVPEANYADSFGLEWNVHARTQYDSTSGIAASESRFFEETGWPRSLDGQILIEPGSGSGRFTEHALDTGATVLSLDHSSAVEANHASNGHHEHLVLVQGDLFRMPFPSGYADKLFCFGVLQHTPDPEGALRSIAAHVRHRGELVADIYIKSVANYMLNTKYWVRPLSRRVEPERLHRLTSRYVDFMWPLARRVRRIPKLGRPLNRRLLVVDHSDLTNKDDVLREWALLDTFDMLSPRYDKPASVRTVRRWCRELGLVADVKRGYNGIEIHARR